MSYNIGLIALILILINIVFTYKGLKYRDVFDQYSFDVDHILLYKDYKRLISSGFLHVSWMHLVFNMMSLFVFSTSMELFINGNAYLFIYFASLLGGSLFSLYIHRNHGDYSAVGASGAVSGIIFACIALDPGMSVGMFFVPVAIPGWLFGPCFVLYSVYGIHSKRDNIGHDAHLGGALVGMVAALITHPSSLLTNYVTILLITVPSVFFIYMIVTRPHLLLIDNLFFKKHRGRIINIDHRYNADKAIQQQQIDAVLEKIHKKGINSLSKNERALLDRYSGSN
jgi:membrane associated rhomboid family serine protease